MIAQKALILISGFSFLIANFSFQAEEKDPCPQ